MSAANAASNTASGKGKGHKKSTKFTPLPSVHALEAFLPWHIEYSNRAGRHAVATEDIPAGTLVLVEQPFLRAPKSKFAAAVCFRCLDLLAPNGEVPPAGNPCLPRYCLACKAVPNAVDGQLAALRIKLPEIAEAHQIELLMLHLVALMDLQRSGIDVGSPLVADSRHPSITNNRKFKDLRCTIADYDSLTNMWDRKPELWRKKVGPALRALHKELTALSEAGTVPGYKVSPITRLQADTAQLPLRINFLTGPTSTTDIAVGVFPGLSLFQHSCVPNCHSYPMESRVLVRTLVDIKAGSDLTVSYVSLLDPRSYRQQQLKNEKHITCACERCTEPMATAIDRWVEGVMCPACNADVMLPLEKGPENEQAKRQYLDVIEKEREAMEARARKRGGKKALTGGKEGKEGGEEGEGEEPSIPVLPEGVMFWRCCSCHAVTSAHSVNGDGPADIIEQATQLVQQGIAYIRVKQLAANGEAALQILADGMEGRLPVYHHLCSTATWPLVTLNLGRGEGVKALKYAIQLWQVDTELSQNLPTMQQLQCLEAVQEAAESKASAVNSAVIKRQLEAKVRAAKKELQRVKPVLLGF